MANFSASLQSAVDALTKAVSTLSPDDQTRVNYAVQELLPVIADELEAVAAQYANRLPVFGGVADNFIKSAITGALDQALNDLAKAKDAIAASAPKAS